MLIQLGMVFISSIGFFIIVGIPLAIAFIIFGVDLTGLTDIRDIFRNTQGTFRYHVEDTSDSILIVIASFLLYIIMVAMLGIYVFGGSIGVIGRSLRDRSLKFSVRHIF